MKSNEQGNRLQEALNHNTSNSFNVIQQKNENYPSKEGQKPPIQSKQGQKGAIQSKQGQKPTIQAKQQPIQRETGEGKVAEGNTNEARVKERVGALMGTDVSDAQVHYNSDKPAQLMAEATAQGKEVHIASGKEQHLGHELTHVAQQKKGNVPVTTQANNGVGINNDPKLEKEADDIGAIAMGNQPIQAKMVNVSSATSSQNQPIQKVEITDKQTIFARFQERLKEMDISGHITADLNEDKLWDDLAYYAPKAKKSVKNLGVNEAAEIMVHNAANYFTKPQKRQRAMSTHSGGKYLTKHLSPELMAELEADPARMAIFLMAAGNTTAPKSKKGNLEQANNDLVDANANVELRLVMAQAELARQDFNAKLKTASGKIKLGKKSVKSKEAPLKKWDRAFDKTTNKYKGNANKVLDIVRGSLIFDMVNDFVKARNTIFQYFPPYRTKSTLGHSTPTGYQDMKINVLLKNGHIGELQIHINSMIEAKDKAGGHSLYRLIRDADEGKVTAFDKNDAKDVEKADKIVDGLDLIIKMLRQKIKEQPNNQKLKKYKTTAAYVKTSIAFARKIDLITLDINQEKAAHLKEISKMVYGDAGGQIKREISHNHGLRKILSKYE